MNVSYVINELKYFIKCCILNQVVHLCRNEYNSQFAFFVERNVVVIKERPINPLMAGGNKKVTHT